MSTISDIRSRPLYLQNDGLDFQRLKTFIEDLTVQEPLLSAVVPIPVVGDLGQAKIDAAILDQLGVANATLSSALGRMYIQWQSDLEIVYLKELITFAVDPLLAQLDVWDAAGLIAYMALPQFPERAYPTGIPEGTTLLNAALSGSALDGTITGGTFVVDANGLDAIDFDALTTLITIPNDATLAGVTSRTWVIRGNFATLGEGGGADKGSLYAWGVAVGGNVHYSGFVSTDRLIRNVDTDTTDAAAISSNNEITQIGSDALTMADYDDADVLGNGRRVRLHEAINSAVNQLALGVDNAATGTFGVTGADLILGNDGNAGHTLDGTVNFWIMFNNAALPFLDGATGIYQTLTDLAGV